MFLLRVVLLVAVQLSLVAAQVLPFLVTGFLNSATPNEGAKINRGGTVTISGFSVTIPDNLLVEFPAAFIPFAEFAAAGPSKRAAPNEVTIIGNIVGDKIIAGQMSISQLDLAFASGVIEALNFDGRIKIENGPIVRINDPRAIYSAGFTELPFFTADDENPSITSFSGYPVCVPRSASDDKCPQSNRPTSGNLATDAKKMVPLKVGDYIEYSGVQFGGETIVYALVANIDLLTSGAQPGFVRVEDAIIGIGDTGVNVEAARFRFIGLASRSDLTIRVFAMDEDPCTGEVTERLVASGNPKADARNKWSLDIPRNTNIGLYTRSYMIRTGDNVVETDDGILAGQYVQPVSEWIFPELIIPGGAPPPNNFDNIGPLRNGFGPIDGQIFGQLSPWPGATAPAPAIASCAPVPSSSSSAPTTEPTGTPDPLNFTASAGIDQTVLGGVAVALSATQDIANAVPASLAYNWTQISGPTVTLSGTNAATVRFSAPVVLTTNANVQRRFQVVITHTPSGGKASTNVTVTSVARGNNVFDHPVIDSLTWASRQSGTATASVHTDLADTTGSMRIIFNSDNVERPMIKAGVANGVTTYTFNSRSIPRYTSATIRSYLNNALVGGPVISSTSVGAG